ncbi:hypothetical protein [Subtercola sp. RTI3]|uniref:hypothetical protein n=1 Tax=Subtercola sp. RTI3 TaxID=3048639 RepID=UPI002B229ED9|nr:hypothetical protein [Subtercola sp. RTI3]MEA9986584.1 hypothetical protein [Subtercola sp. RTI3]
MSAAGGLPGDAGSVRAAWVEGAVIVNGRALPGLPDLTRGSAAHGSAAHRSAAHGSAAHGSADARPHALAVVPADAVLGTADLVAMAGSWQREIGGLRFTPRFAAAPGSVFVVARRDPASGVWAECARVAVPGGPPPRLTTVVSIDPGGGEVPANLLRFAVTFSHEMSEGSSAGQLRLLDANGTEIAGALYDLPPELWDRSRRRLTVLLEPGRIKRGLQPNAVVGALLGAPCSQRAPRAASASRRPCAPTSIRPGGSCAGRHAAPPAVACWAAMRSWFGSRGRSTARSH